MSVFVHLAVASFVLILNSSEAARILAVFPISSISHQVVFRVLTHELARRGHEVVVITPDPVFPRGQAPENLTEIDVHDISYKTWHEYVIVASKGNQDNLEEQLSRASRAITLIVEQQLLHEKVQNIIADKNRTFDLLLLEACVKPALIYSHIYKNVPVIQVSSLGGMTSNFETVGAPTHPLLYPVPLRQKINNLSSWEKITEVYNIYHSENIFEDPHIIEDMFKRNFGSDVPSMEKLLDNVDMLFLNVYPVFDGIRPVPPTVVYMGGLHQNPEKELPNELKSYLDSSKNGVIYMSFGTNVDPALLPPEKIQTFVRVFSKLPYNVLWKWNKDDLPGCSDNIMISKWLPQSDLLKHPNIKLFITQGGLQSTDEAITAGVPLIGVPMHGDQWFNIEKYIQHGIGVRLDIEPLTDDLLKNTIEHVITDQRYRRNVVHLRKLMNDQPQGPLERAVWWTEYVLRHGGAKHLRAPAANMPWTQYLELELVFTLLLALFTAAAIVVISLYYLYTKIKQYLSFPVKIKQT